MKPLQPSECQHTKKKGRKRKMSNDSSEVTTSVRPPSEL